MGRPATQVVRGVEALDVLDFSGKTVYGDFRDDLIRDGVAVIKGAVPKERAAQYASDFHSYLEGFGLGYKRDDPSTVNYDMLPIINEKGMISVHYGASHEDFVWKVRCEKDVRGAFEKIYGTDDLIVSFDCINCTFPKRTDIAANKPWAHQDQDPERPGFRCVQSLVNLQPSGPDDGGLVIMKGSHLISAEYHDAFRKEERLWQWTNEWYGYKETGLKWLEEKGYKFEKICAEQGDLILWDSRAAHYNRSPTTDQVRMAIYVCMAPAYTATQEELIKKREAFLTYAGTSHWPQCLQTAKFPMTRKDGTTCKAARDEPFNPPVLNDHDFQLTGIPYITASA